MWQVTPYLIELPLLMSLSPSDWIVMTDPDTSAESTVDETQAGAEAAAEVSEAPAESQNSAE